MTEFPTKRRGGMGTTIAIVVVVVIVLAAIGGYYFLTQTKAPTKVTVDIAGGTGINSSLNFNPSTITVVIGVNNTIAFNNNDNVTHTVTFTSAPSGVNAGSLTDSNLAAGTSYTIGPLTVAGTYSYHCTIHSWMTGTIVVKS